jgi:hypothetical protein
LAVCQQRFDPLRIRRPAAGQNLVGAMALDRRFAGAVSSAPAHDLDRLLDGVLGDLLDLVLGEGALTWPSGEMVSCMPSVTDSGSGGPSRSRSYGVASA